MDYKQFSEQIDRNTPVTINFDKTLTVCKLFFGNDKGLFLRNFYELDSPGKHLAMLSITTEFIDLPYAKKMFLEELRPELTALKDSNRREGFSYNTDVDRLHNELTKELRSIAF